MFVSILIYRKTVFLILLFRNDVDFLHEYGFLKNDNNCLCKEIRKINLQQNEGNLDYTKREEDSIIEIIVKI